MISEFVRSPPGVSCFVEEVVGISEDLLRSSKVSQSEVGEDVTTLSEYKKAQR